MQSSTTGIENVSLRWHLCFKTFYSFQCLLVVLPTENCRRWQRRRHVCRRSHFFGTKCIRHTLKRNMLQTKRLGARSKKVPITAAVILQTHLCLQVCLPASQRTTDMGQTLAMEQCWIPNPTTSINIMQSHTRDAINRMTQSVAQ